MSSGQVIRARERMPTGRRSRSGGAVAARAPPAQTVEADDEHRPTAYSCAYFNSNACLNDPIEGHQYCIDHLVRDEMVKLRQPRRREQPQELNLSFCGCGFLGIYHVGVASCFHEYAPQLSMNKVAGSSAGALVAVSYICGNLQLAYATTDILRVAIDARSHSLGAFSPAFDINATVREALERGLPEDVHLRASGKLHVSLTRVSDYKNFIISEFDSKEDVIQVLLCSCFIPLFSGFTPPKYKGTYYMDGGFSDNLLTIGENTVTVSPFAGEADICPQDDTLNLLQINLSNTSFSISPDNLYRIKCALRPPAPEVLSSLCEQGFADGIRYLQRMKLISCTKCLEFRSSLLVASDGEDFEESVKQRRQPQQQQQQQQELAAQLPRVASSSSTISAWSIEGASGKQFNLVAPTQSDYHTSEQHFHLDHQDQQKILELSTGDRRRDSVVSTTSLIFQQQQQQQQEVAQAAASANLNHLLEVGTSELAAANTIPGHTVLPVTRKGRKRKFKFGPSSSRQQTDTSGELASGSDSDDEADEFNRCYECVKIRRKALRKNLPKLFSDRIRDACDTVNKSLSNWIYSHRPIKYLSYLAAPYYLPIEISLALTAKCWHRLPEIRSEISHYLTEFVGLLLQILKQLQEKSAAALLVAPESLVGGLLTAELFKVEAEPISQQKKFNAASRPQLVCSKQQVGVNNPTRKSSVNSTPPLPSTYHYKGDGGGGGGGPGASIESTSSSQQQQQFQLYQVVTTAAALLSRMPQE